MSHYPTAADVYSWLKTTLANQITWTLKALLQSKHLYQSFVVEYDDMLHKNLQNEVPQSRKAIENRFLAKLQGQWFPVDKARRGIIYPGPATESNEKGKFIGFEVPDVKLFCEVCNGVEAFNSVSAEDFLQRDRWAEPFLVSKQTVQIFVLSFLCQSCKSVPEVFLVRRHGTKLTISGRSPIEHVYVPPVVPKPVRSFYSGAVVAHQSGQTLAGNFLLRTMIEQWARSKAPSGDPHADLVLDSYMDSLPEDFKSRFPSLRSLYTELSDDIHAATGSAELFDKACTQIVEHFDARRLYKL